MGKFNHLFEPLLCRCTKILPKFNFYLIRTLIYDFP